MGMILPNIYHFHGRVANSYILIEPDGLTLIDCGIRFDGSGLFKQIQKLGFPARPLKRILITHSDGDHTGSASFLVKATGAPLCASEGEKAAIEAGKSSRELKGGAILQTLMKVTKPLFNAGPVKVDCILQPGEVLPVLRGLKVLATPGHTPGHLSFWLEEERALFAGDSVWLSNGIPRISGAYNTWDEILAKSSLDQQMALKPRYLCAGHVCTLLTGL